MAYEIEDIRTSQEIFYYLLEHHEMSEEAQERLFRGYAENERIQNLVKSQGEAAECDIERYGDVVYLIPREDNTFLGFSKAQLKQLLCKSGGTDKDYYLSQFVILTLLVEFYDGQGATSKTRDYMRVGELQNCVSGRLREGAERAEEDGEEGASGGGGHSGGERLGLAFSNMIEAYEALRSDERFPGQDHQGGLPLQHPELPPKAGLDRVCGGGRDDQDHQEAGSVHGLEPAEPEPFPAGAQNPGRRKCVKNF